MDVPEIVFVAVSDPIQAEVMFVPGAKRSTTDPPLEVLAITSEIVEFATVKASVTRAGEKPLASDAEFPAAMA
jgi:hypothetical protein